MSRLIDADALKDKILYTDDYYETPYVEWDDILEQPTVAAPRWRRVEEKLPDEVGSYLVYAPTYIGGSSSAKECKAGVMFARWLKGGHWSIEVGYYKRPGCVTHWMPIEPPKEDA